MSASVIRVFIPRAHPSSMVSLVTVLMRLDEQYSGTHATNVDCLEAAVAKITLATKKGRTT